MEEKIYKEMYLHLFNAVTDALELMGRDDEAAQQKLMAAQQECEQMFINAGDCTLCTNKKRREQAPALRYFFTIHYYLFTRFCGASRAPPPTKEK